MIAPTYAFYASPSRDEGRVRYRRLQTFVVAKGFEHGEATIGIGALKVLTLTLVYT